MYTVIPTLTKWYLLRVATTQPGCILYLLYTNQSAGCWTRILSTYCIITWAHYSIVLTPMLSTVILWRPLGTGTRVIDQHNHYITVSTHAKCTLMDLKAITEKSHIVWVIVTLIKYADFKSQLLATYRS